MNILDVIATFSGLLPYILDGMIIIMLLVAIFIGGGRTYRKSLAELLSQVISLIGAILIGSWLAEKATSFMLDRFNFTAILPSRYSIIAEPLLESLFNPFLLLIFGAIIFAFIKSIFGGINLETKLLTKWRLTRRFDLLLSIIFSALNMFTHLLVVIVIFAFPFFNIVREGTIAASILKLTPIVTSQVEQMYGPFGALQDAMKFLNSEIGDLKELDESDLEPIIEWVAENPQQINHLITLVPNETMAEINQALDQYGVTQEEAINEIQRQLDQGELTVEEIQRMLRNLYPR